MNRVYYMNITPLLDKNEFEKNIVKVNKARQEKAKRLFSQTAKAQSLGAGLLLKYAVENDTKLDYEKLNFLTDVNGKPYVEGNSFYFSLSHSGDCAVCVVSDSPVGVDVEKEKELSKAMQERFAENILEWTKKEAKGKLIGGGVFDKTEGDFVYSHHKTTDGYIITVCSDKNFQEFIEI